MKLLYLHNGQVDSTEAHIVQVLHMCHAFTELGVRVSLALPEDGLEAERVLDSIEKKIGKEVKFSVKLYHKTIIGGRLRMIGGYLGVRDLLNDERADYCFVRNTVLVNATLKHGIPTIYESHSATIHNNCILDFLWRRNLIKNASRRNLKKFVAISQSLADKWIDRGIPAEKLLTLHDGVDTDNFRALQDEKELRAKLDLPLKKKIVTYAGSLYGDRGIEDILILAKYFPDVLFLVIGGPQERAAYYAKESSRWRIANIRFLGYVLHCNVRHYLMASDVLLMLWSRKVKTIDWCSPLKMFEYMAAGKIIVGHGFPTIQEVLTNNKNALLADPGSFDELKGKLARALQLGYPNLIAARARKLAFEKYDWKKRATAIVQQVMNTSEV